MAGHDGPHRQRDGGVVRRSQDPAVGGLDHLRGPVRVEDRAIDRVVDDHLDVLDGLGRGLLCGVVDTRLEEDVERGAEALLLQLELRDALGLGGRQRQGLELREDAANIVELLHEGIELRPHVLGCFAR